MRIIGITGPSGSGKSFIGNILEAKGIPCIDADEVYHSLLVPPSPCLDALRSAFGDSVFYTDGSLDRSALGRIVFSDADKLDLLNSTVLSFVIDKTRTLIKELGNAGHCAVAVDAPTLIESGFDKECDTVVSVIAPKHVRIERIMKRDGISLADAELRVKAQKDDSFYINASDTVITNSDSRDSVEEKISELLAALR